MVKSSHVADAGGWARQQREATTINPYRMARVTSRFTLRMEIIRGVRLRENMTNSVVCAARQYGQQSPPKRIVDWLCVTTSSGAKPGPLESPNVTAPI